MMMALPLFANLVIIHVKHAQQLVSVPHVMK